MSVQGNYSPFSMSPLLDSDFQTWSLVEGLEKTGPYQMVYITGFSKDKKKVKIETLDWNNDKCIDPQFARKLVADRSIAALQYNGDGVVLYVSEKQKDNFKRHKDYKVVYQGQGKKSDKKICSPRGTSFLNETKFAETTPWFKHFCISSVERRKSPIAQ